MDRHDDGRKAQWRENESFRNSSRSRLKYSRPNNSTTSVVSGLDSHPLWQTEDSFGASPPAFLDNTTTKVTIPRYSQVSFDERDHTDKFKPFRDLSRHKTFLESVSLGAPEETGFSLRSPSPKMQLTTRPTMTSHTSNNPTSTTYQVIAPLDYVAEPLMSDTTKTTGSNKIPLSSEASWATRKQSVGNQLNSNGTEVYDKFYTPKNQCFYSNKPYTPLNPKRQEIRLVRVFPRKSLREHFKNNEGWDRAHASDLDGGHQLLACQIEKTALARVDGQYSTISYCAGDLQDTKVMLVNGIPFNAFANLEHAIACVLSHWPPGSQESYMLWLDQICINQSDKQELGEQVQLMREIYRRSRQTFVCLSTPRVSDCLSWIPRVPDYSEGFNTKPKKQSTAGVVALQDLLLDFLVGEGRGGDLRPSQSRRSTALDSVSEVEGLDPNGSRHKALQLLRPRASMQRLSLHQVPSIPQLVSTITQTSRQSRIHTMTPSSNNLTSQFDIMNGKILTSPDDFQKSLREFMTNKWWRR
jgi:hypothetical protein